MDPARAAREAAYEGMVRLEERARGLADAAHELYVGVLRTIDRFDEAELDRMVGEVVESAAALKGLIGRCSVLAGQKERNGNGKKEK